MTLTLCTPYLHIQDRKKMDYSDITPSRELVPQDEQLSVSAGPAFEYIDEVGIEIVDHEEDGKVPLFKPAKPR